MTKETVGKTIASEARKAKLCKPWLAEMTKAEDIKPLCEMYFKGDDWAMEKDFPSLATLRKFKGESDAHGLYTDFKGTVGFVSGTQQNAAFFGKSDAQMDCAPFTVGEVVIRHDSKVKMTAKENVFLVVNLLDNGFVEVEAGDNSKVTVFQYGQKSNFRITGNVEIKEGKFEK